MPANKHIPHAFDYSDDLSAGRQDLQHDCHMFFDTLFANCTVLDVGAGLGVSKSRIRHNKVTTHDIDTRLAHLVDVVGDLPATAYDVVTAFDVIEHVQDDVGFLADISFRAARALFLTTPNWVISKCQSTHHWREYTSDELIDLATGRGEWDPAQLRLFAMKKDQWGAWFDLVPQKEWSGHLGLKHGLLALRELEDAKRIDRFMEDRWA